MIKYYPKKKEIKIAMAIKGLNKRELSKNGRYNLSSKSSRKIAEALNCKIEDIFEIYVDREKI